MNELDERLNLQAQATAVGLASALSLGFAVVVPSFFSGYRSSDLPFEIAFNWTAVLTLALWVYLIVSPQQWRRIVFPSSGPRQRGLWATRIDVAALYLLVLACIALLGWFTLGSGGTLRSPFSGALLALALLSPFISSRWFTPIVVGIPVLGAYYVFSELFWPNLDVQVEVPPMMTFVMSLITTVIALGIAVFVKRRDERTSATIPVPHTDKV
jgi:hypothetical protein